MTTVRRAAAALLITAIVACQPSVVESPSPSAHGSAAPTVSLAPVTSDPPFRGTSWPAGRIDPCDLEDYPGLLGRIEATEELEVVFTLCRPDAAFPARLAHPSFAILDSATIDRLGGPIREHVPLAGTGPYRVQRWIADTELELARNDRYAGTPPGLDTIVLRWDELGAQRLVELHSTTVDAIDSPDPGDAETIRNDPGLALIERPRLATVYLGFTPTAPFDETAMRAALALALDRPTLVEEAMSPGSLLADHLAPCAVPAGCVGAAWPKSDPPMARESLAAAGLDLGVTYPLHVARSTVAGGTSLPTLAARVASQLAERVSLRVEVVEMDPEAFSTALVAGELPGMHLGIVETELADPGPFLGLPVRATGEFGTADPELTTAIRDAGRTPDARARESLFTRAADRIRATVPLIPLGHPGETAAFLADVANAHTSPLGVEMIGAMTPGDRPQLVWMQAAEPRSLYCADERRFDAYRACALVTESLYGFETGGARPVPRLADRCSPSEDATTWTCQLRADIRFHDGARFDAADVVASFAAMWDRGHPAQAERPEGSFRNWTELFGGQLAP